MIREARDSGVLCSVTPLPSLEPLCTWGLEEGALRRLRRADSRHDRRSTGWKANQPVTHPAPTVSRSCAMRGSPNRV